MLTLSISTLAAGCGGVDHIPLGDTCAVPATYASQNDVVAEMVESGGFAGKVETTVIYADGRVRILGHDTRHLKAEGGNVAAARLMAALLKTGVYDLDQGCYVPALETTDAFNTAVILKRLGEWYRFSAEEHAAPGELDEAVGLIRAYVAAAK